MSKPRPKSSYSSYSNSSRSQPKMQVKYKSRTSSVIVDDLGESIFIKSKEVQETPKSKGRSRSAIGEDLFNKTSSKLKECNFKHHDPNVCVCEHCTCGRHLCKLHIVRPDMRKASQYQKQFVKKKSVPNMVNIAKQYDKLDGPHLQLNTTYGKHFQPNKGDDLQRPKPQDLLKTGGPSQNLTSYKADYPGHKGKNQYVPPTDKHTRGDFPFNGKSTYATGFPFKSPKKDDWDGIPNNLKTGKKWLGGSTYNDKFKSPNPEHYPHHIKIKEKLQLNPDYCNQYQTNYRNDFLAKGRGICPAKIALQTKQRGNFKDSKTNFQENTDYKALSPDFRAISTSRV